VICCRRVEVVPVSEGWKSVVKEVRVSRAESWVAEERRVGSIVEGEGAVCGEGREGWSEEGGRSRESQVSRSVFRLV